MSPCFFTHPATTEIYTLSLHDALPISQDAAAWSERCLRYFQGFSQRPLPDARAAVAADRGEPARSEEHTSELQSLRHLVCRLLLEKKKTKHKIGANIRLTTDSSPEHIG